MADRDRLTRRLRVLTVITVVCYVIGYSLALGAGTAIGWIFVGLGGPFLIALLITVVQRVHVDAESDRNQIQDSQA